MKLKLTKLELYWVLHDVGNSAFSLMLATIIPIFFKNITNTANIASSTSTAYWSYILSISTLIVGILGPSLGRLGDKKDNKRKYFSLFLIIGCICCALLGIISKWQIFLIVFLLARVGYSISLIYYDSMLIDVTSDERSDEVSSFGYAYGYIGSCIPFVFCLVLLLNYETFNLSFYIAGAISFIIVSLWWFLLTVPLLKNYKQKYYSDINEKVNFSMVFKSFKETFYKVKQNKSLWLFMLAYFFYIDGVYTIIELATSYGKDVGISDSNLLMALLLTQIVAFPFALLFGYLSKKVKTRNLIKISVFGYILIVLFALQLDKAWEFWFLAVCVAIFQGAIQALSRSYFSRLIPKENSNEFFGLFDIFGKGAAFTGTLLVGVITQITGVTQYGVATILILLIVGLVILSKVPTNQADI